MNKKQDRQSAGRIQWILFAVYCVIMLWLLFGQRIGWYSPEAYWEQLDKNVNLVPFRTIMWFITLPEKTSNVYLLRHGLVNLLGNVVLFIPLGIFLPQLWVKMRAFWKVFLVVTGLILLVEALQLFALLGSCDVDDLILNVVGASMGYGLWKWWMSAEKRRTQPKDN